MQDKTKNKIITIGFSIILAVVFFTNLIAKDNASSVYERRKLAQFPEITISGVLSGDVMEEFEKYAEDQFFERDFFRWIKAFWGTKILGQKDYNNLFEKGEWLYKMTYPLKENNIKKSAEKIKYTYDKYLKGMNVYYSIIPDKPYFLKDDDHLKIDYNKVQQIVGEELSEIKYIDITEALELEDFYRTDMHWRQESLQDVVKLFLRNMGAKIIETKYEMQDRGAFYGSHYGQLGTKVKPDTLYTLVNDTLNKCTVYDYEKKRNIPMYLNINSLTSRYDTFLSGSKPLITIDNPNAPTNKELLLFRDSFGSSIAPLFVENYRKVTLIDLRYISKDLLGDYIEFKDQDVLFLYNYLVLNNNTFL